MKRLTLLVILVLGALGLTYGLYSGSQPTGPYAELELKLAPLAQALEKPRPGDWLDKYPEAGQTFAEYLRANPVRRDAQRHTIYLCLLGDFTPEQQRIMDVTRAYLEVYFDAPVKIQRRVPLEQVPDHARRKHPNWGDAQILSTYVLEQLLQPDRPADALAYVAFTASDLWPGPGWNFVFGQASLQERTGVWSIYRFGDPAASPAEYQRCLVRTLRVATHETGHILTMHHCTAYQCNMNGSNSLPESDRRPMHLCPVCLRKLCWNLNVQPTPYLTRLRDFCTKHDLTAEAEWYGKALTALEKADR